MVSNQSPANVVESQSTFPENLFREVYDMSSMSFMVYSIGYIMDVARDDKCELKGLSHKDGVRQVSPDSRTLTPKEVLDIIENNRDLLKEHYKSEFEDGENYELLKGNLEMMQGKTRFCWNVNSKFPFDIYKSILCRFLNSQSMYSLFPVRTSQFVQGIRSSVDLGRIR